MASRVLARALETDDLEPLSRIDTSYAEKTGLDPVVTRASLNFYVRTGHAFVSLIGETIADATISGFVLAQSVWNGQRPVVQVARLALGNLEDDASRQVLLEAITKSAYDAAVYEVWAFNALTDEKGEMALLEQQYKALALRVYGRKLGQRGSLGKGL